MTVIKITRRSLCEFQFGDDQPVIKLDVIAVSDQWHELDSSFREQKDDMNIVPPQRFNEYTQARLNFVQSIVNDACGVAAPTLTRAEAEEFIFQVHAEVAKLRNFIYKPKGETSSSPENTEQPPAESVTFSQ